MKHFIIQVVTKNGQQHALWFQDYPRAEAAFNSFFGSKSPLTLNVVDDYGHRVSVDATEFSTCYFSDVARDLECFSDAGILAQKADRIHKARLEKEMMEAQPGNVLRKM